MMLQQELPRDYVIATGVRYSVRQFIEKSAAQLGIPIRGEGKGREGEGRLVARRHALLKDEGRW